MLDLYVNVILNFCCFLFNYEINVYYIDDFKLFGFLFIDLFFIFILKCYESIFKKV